MSIRYTARYDSGHWYPALCAGLQELRDELLSQPIDALDRAHRMVLGRVRCDGDAIDEDSWEPLDRCWLCGVPSDTDIALALARRTQPASAEDAALIADWWLL